MRAITRRFSIFGFAALLALAVSAVLAAAAAAAPSGNPPTITPASASGTSSPQVGDMLTDVTGGWTGTGTVTVAVQWLDCNSSGTGCVNVAANGTGQTYTLTPADVGFTIEVQETATDSNPGSTILMSGPTLVVGLPPSNTAPPTISGIPQQGQTLNDINGTWTNNPTSFAYQWQDCNSSGTSCVNVAANGTGQSYTLTPADVGFTIEVQETASNAGGPGTPANSAPTATVIPLPPANQGPPTISGTTQQGQQLTETNGSWTNNPTSFVYQWLRCDNTGNGCANIRNATGQTYTLTSADVNNTIAVDETASNLGGTATVQSAATAVITPPPVAPVNQTLPSITGTTQQGQTLTEIPGIWSPAPTSFSYQWLECDSAGSNCTSIPGATGPTYAPTEALLGNTVRVQETASNGTVAGNPAVSAQTAAISLNPSSTILLTQPGSPVTNQPVTLIATVTTSFAQAPPAGYVAFDDGATPISGCSGITVSTLNLSVPATCQATFAAGTSPHALTATFTPNLGAGIAGSTSQSLSLRVGQAQTSTSLDVASPTVFIGSKATYTATVATGQGAPVQPTGSVQFTDKGKPIASCPAQRLVQSQGSLSAQCTIRYRKRGRHTITAQYSGDGNFGGSAASSQAVRVQPRPTGIAGAITAKTYWTDFYTPAYTRFLAMAVQRLRLGTRIILLCRGQGCPFTRQSLVVTTKACRASAPCVTERAQVVNLFPHLRGRRFHVGTVFTVELTRPNWIGKAYVISIRSGRRPSDRISCLAPGSTRPGVGC